MVDSTGNSLISLFADPDQDYYYQGLEVKYDDEYDCSEYGCGEEGICRCGRIIDAVVEEIHSSHFANAFLPTGTSEVEACLVERLIKHCLNPSAFNVFTCGGYKSRQPSRPSAGYPCGARTPWLQRPDSAPRAD